VHLRRVEVIKEIVVEEDGTMNKKPPIGILPKHIHDEMRFIKIGEAIIRFVEARCQIPEEWIYEYNDLANRIDLFKEG
jgi:hypothetical protein